MFWNVQDEKIESVEGEELPQAPESEKSILMMIKQPRRKFDMKSLRIFSVDSFMPMFVGLLDHENNPDIMLLTPIHRPIYVVRCFLHA